MTKNKTIEEKDEFDKLLQDFINCPINNNPPLSTNVPSIMESVSHLTGLQSVK